MLTRCFAPALAWAEDDRYFFLPSRSRNEPPPLFSTIPPPPRFPPAPLPPAASIPTRSTHGMPEKREDANVASGNLLAIHTPAMRLVRISAPRPASALSRYTAPNVVAY